MAKRLLDLSNEESELRKKIKLENEIILDKIKEIDISEHEVEKFLLIFHPLTETVNSEESLDNTDSNVSDTILKIVLPSSNPYWRRTKEKYKQTKVYNIRYQTQYNIRALALVKGRYYYNHKSKEYKHHNWQDKQIAF